MAGDTSNRLADKFKDLAFCFDASKRCGCGTNGRAGSCKPATKQVNCCSSPGMSNCCGGCQVKMNQCNCWCQPSNGCCNIQQEYCELKAKYRCLCLKAAQLLQERNQRNLDKDGCNDEDTVFLRGLYPFINTLSTERKLNLRMAFQELMYKYAFNDQVSAAQMMPQNGLKTQRPAFGDVTVSKKKDICLSQSDEEEFYESMLPYLRNLTPEKKLLFRESVFDALRSEVLDEEEYQARLALERESRKKKKHKKHRRSKEDNGGGEDDEDLQNEEEDEDPEYYRLLQDEEDKERRKSRKKKRRERKSKKRYSKTSSQGSEDNYPKKGRKKHRTRRDSSTLTDLKGKDIVVKTSQKEVKSEGDNAKGGSKMKVSSIHSKTSSKGFEPVIKEDKSKSPAKQKTNDNKSRGSSGKNKKGEWRKNPNQRESSGSPDRSVGSTKNAGKGGKNNKDTGGTNTPDKRDKSISPNRVKINDNTKTKSISPNRPKINDNTKNTNRGGRSPSPKKRGTSGTSGKSDGSGGDGIKSSNKPESRQKSPVPPANSKKVYVDLRSKSPTKPETPKGRNSKGSKPSSIDSKIPIAVYRLSDGSYNNYHRMSHEKTRTQYGNELIFDDENPCLRPSLRFNRVKVSSK